MTFYVAAPYECRTEARTLERALEVAGYVSVTGWLVDYPGHGLNAASARLDFADVARSDVLIAMNPPGWERVGTGGRHAELGYAIALDKRIVLVGRRSNVFHYWPEILVVSDTDGVVKALGQLTARV